MIGEIGASAAPAIITSATPSSMSWAAWPTASSPDVQPVDIVITEPPAPCRVATSAANVLGTIAW